MRCIHVYASSMRDSKDNVTGVPLPMPFGILISVPARSCSHSRTPPPFQITKEISSQRVAVQPDKASFWTGSARKPYNLMVFWLLTLGLLAIIPAPASAETFFYLVRWAEPEDSLFATPSQTGWGSAWGSAFPGTSAARSGKSSSSYSEALTGLLRSGSGQPRTAPWRHSAPRIPPG